MKKILLILVLLILILAGIGYSYYHFNSQIPTTEIKDTPFSQYLKNEKETFKESAEWFDASIEYPRNNQKVRDIIFDQWNGFAKESRLHDFKNFEEAKNELQLNVEGLKYSFTANYKIATSSDTISYVYEVYTFTGGAHGATDIFPITLNKNLQILKAEDILPEKSLEKVSRLAVDDLLKQKRERMKSYGMTEKDIAESMLENSSDTTWIKEGTKPVRDNYSHVWIDGEDIVISFGQYQVGPYVEGIYEVKIPKSQI
jgi:uncharacterized protein YxeA